MRRTMPASCPQPFRQCSLTAERLACLRQDRRLFQDLSFGIESGGIVQVAGANGSGKTTLLRMLCGLLPPESGEIRWCGRDIHRERSDYLADLLYIGHAPGIKNELTAVENLRFLCALHPTETGVDPADALAQLGLYGFEEVPVRTLSAGQRRRVALARLLFSRAPLWILDEPFTALDVDGQALIHRLLEQHSRAGGLSIITTHQPLALEGCAVQRVELGA